MKRPKTRGECVDGPRPCPWASCRHHLLLYVTAVGSIRKTHATIDKLPESCSLDVAERGGLTLSEVGELMGCTRERVRQIEVATLLKLRAAVNARG